MTNFRMHMFSLECFSALYHELTAFLAGETNVPESIYTGERKECTWENFGLPQIVVSLSQEVQYQFPI